MNMIIGSVDVLIGSVGILIGSVDISMGSVGILIHRYLADLPPPSHICVYACVYAYTRANFL